MKELYCYPCDLPFKNRGEHLKFIGKETWNEMEVPRERPPGWGTEVQVTKPGRVGWSPPVEAKPEVKEVKKDG